MVFPSGKFMDISTFSSGIYIAEVILGNKKMNKILLEIFSVFQNNFHLNSYFKITFT